MNTNISCLDGVTAMYKTLLEIKIPEVMLKIGETFEEDVTWLIFDEKQLAQRESLIPHPVRFKNKYGFCFPEINEIWISTAAIIQSNITPKFNNKSINAAMKFLPKQRDLLAEVIIDEIAHIKTKRGHGDLVYDTLLETYKNLLFS
ncbi:hypothetical protein [Paenibacillus sp. Leaf72]|uniref:hypothetical protein n=1 Tax=Paenibacillus sp. Leaf72 TaxID=1736234 RepID=UPI00070032CC|nr:hypothetical protein [Paenibacillus sp. Leaf72]KQN96882.1 hypothetical protein ASF12_22705 [Paenibacillus sp. Leaf72]